MHTRRAVGDYGRLVKIKTCSGLPCCCCTLARGTIPRPVTMFSSNGACKAPDMTSCVAAHCNNFVWIIVTTCKLQACC
jgi:hypothetical protein